MVEPLFGYREVEHTADWELAVWAPDLSTLFEQAARGMYALAETRLDNGPRTGLVFDLQAADEESLLVSYLSELLFLAESQNLGFDRFDLAIQGGHLTAQLQGATISSQSKEIKAVTYHNLVIQHGPRGLQVNIVFDV